MAPLTNSETSLDGPFFPVAEEPFAPLLLFLVFPLAEGVFLPLVSVADLPVNEGK